MKSNCGVNLSVICPVPLCPPQVFGMSQSDSKGLVLGVLAGAAGLTLAVVWYQSRKASSGRMVAQELYLNSNDRHVGASMNVALAGQREVLDRLGALIQCVSELKEEVRVRVCVCVCDALGLFCVKMLCFSGCGIYRPTTCTVFNLHSLFGTF